MFPWIFILLYWWITIYLYYDIENFNIKSVEFSAEAGFYDEPFYLTLSAPDGCNIFYTLDGSTPDKNAILSRMS